jgi:hypothetical protein
MHLSEPVVIALVVNGVAWLIQFVALKTDTRWIKDRLKKGDRTLDRHARILSSHRSQIAEIKGVCSTRHGTVFSPVGATLAEEGDNHDE